VKDFLPYFLGSSAVASVLIMLALGNMSQFLIIAYMLTGIVAFGYGILWAWWILKLLIRGAKLVEAATAYIKKITP
jgi:hypothetical protein